MQVSELRIENLLEFLPEQGKILLEGSRAIIIDAASLGMLRKDLIATLGMDRAKGFLIRYGWACGFEAAMNTKRQYPWDEDREEVFSGPIMHTLQGFVLSHHFKKIDQQTGSRFYHGTWTNSYEAEQHILHFGYHHEPVCWNLAGYASGYSSARLGKRIIYKEIQCVGKGDDRCTYVGKAIEDWGDEILPELSYYEVSKISEELEEAHHRIKDQNKVLERAVTIHEQLTQCILNGQGIDDITSSLAKLMKCTVVLENRHLEPLSIGIPDRLSAKNHLVPYLPISDSPSFQNNAAFYMQQTRSFEITDHYPDILINRLVGPIIVGQQLLGFVSFLRSGLPFTELEHIAVEHSASVFALEMLKQKEIAAVENRLKGDFIDDLLSENFSDPNSIINRARGLDYDITQPHRVLVFDICNFTQVVQSLKQDEKKIFQFKNDLVNIVKSCLKHPSKGMVVTKSDHLIMLIQTNHLDSHKKGIKELAEQIIEQVANRFPKVTLTVGIGSNCIQLADFFRSYQSAQKAIEIGKALNKQGQVVSFEQFGAHTLLFSAFNPSDLSRFATTQIGSLLTYDASYQSQLVPTLLEFLNNRSNVERTARSMNLSVSGLKYRLQRIEEITGQDPKDPQASFNLQLALNILQLMGKDEITGYS
ncbi:MAG: XylR N-terminal domain-containing protein [Desulfitobacteriaceae bacterium]